MKKLLYNVKVCNVVFVGNNLQRSPSGWLIICLAVTSKRYS